MIIARARARRQAIEENIASNRSTFVVIPKPKDCGKSWLYYKGYFMDFMWFYFIPHILITISGNIKGLKKLAL